MRAAALALLGALGLTACAALQWFRFDAVHFACAGWTCYAPLTDDKIAGPPVVWGNALGGLGPVAAVALVACVLAALAAAGAALRPGSGARGPLTVLLGLSTVATAVLVARVVSQPGLGGGYPDRLVDVTPAAWTGVGFAVLALLGVALARRTAPAAPLS